MTDRHSGYIVILAQPIREDDAEATLNAIRQIKGVLEVKPMITDWRAEDAGLVRERVRIAEGLQELIWPKAPDARRQAANSATEDEEARQRR